MIVCNLQRIVFTASTLKVLSHAGRSYFWRSSRRIFILETEPSVVLKHQLIYALLQCYDYEKVIDIDCTSSEKIKPVSRKLRRSMKCYVTDNALNVKETAVYTHVNGE